MKQFDLFKTEDELFIEESESFIFELEKHIDKLEAQEKFVEENNGFDWAKEFPQLCDDKGNWQGFDAIVGNPPYIDIRNIKEHYKSFYNIFYKEQKNNFDLYSLFIQRALSLLKSEGVLSFIVPKPILYNSTFKPIRKIIFENTLNQIYVPDKLVFDKVFVETVILFIEKKKTPNNEFIINRQDVLIKIVENDEHKAGNAIILADDKTINILSKLRKRPKLMDFVEIIRGLELGKRTIQPQAQNAKKCVKIFAGEAFQKYTFFEDKMIFVSKEEIKPFIKNTEQRFCEYPRIIMRRVRYS